MSPERVTRDGPRWTRPRNQAKKVGREVANSFFKSDKKPDLSKAYLISDLARLGRVVLTFFSCVKPPDSAYVKLSLLSFPLS